MSSAIAFTNSLLRAVFDAIPSPVYFKDPSGVFLGCNDAYERFMGMTRDRIIGNTIEDIAPPALAAQVNDLDRKLMQGEGIQIYEATILLPDGREANVLEKRSVFTGPDGKVIGFVGEITDMSMLKDAEKALEASEERFYHLMEVADEGVCLHRDGVFIETNSRMAGMLGLSSKEELIGKDIFRFLSPESEAIARKNISSGYSDSYELEVVKSDGTSFRASIKGRDFELNGETVRLAVIRNLTECCNAQNRAALDWLK